MYKDQYQGWPSRMLRYFSLQLGVELNEKCWTILHHLHSREFLFQPRSLVEAAETDPYAKESTRLIKDMFKDLCYTYDLDIENLDEMLITFTIRLT